MHAYCYFSDCSAIGMQNGAWYIHLVAGLV